MQIDSSTILVTGGSSGLGAACVEMLARRGARVIVADLAPPRDDAFAGVRRSRAVRDRPMSPAKPTCARPSRPARSDSDRCAAWSPAPACCTPNVCWGANGVASLEAFRRVIDINLNGTFNTVRLAAEAIARSEPQEDDLRGVVVMTSSVSAFEGQIGQAAYSASKGGVASLTLPLARELGQHGIRVVSIAPGVFDTPMMQAAPDKVRQSLIEQIPFPHRFGQPDEFASLVCHVFENNMLNGCVLRLDGAIRMGPK